MEGLPSLPVIDRVARTDSYEFPYCDMRHEALQRDERGKPVNQGKTPEALCPMTCRQNRPACAHFTETDTEHRLPDPIENNLAFITEHGVPDAEELTERYRTLRTALRNGQSGPLERGMDVMMREARCGTKTGGDIPTAEEAKQNAALLIPMHRKLVDEMQTVVTDIGAALRTLLQQEADSSMMSPCAEPSSSPSGSSPMSHSSSLHTPSDISQESVSSSRPTSPSISI